MAFWNTKKQATNEKFINGMRGFAGAKGGRLVDDWVTTSKSINELMKQSLSKLRRNSRDLELNNEYIRSFLRSTENNVIGRGVQFQVQAKASGKVTETEQEQINSNIENQFFDWTKADSCDVSGTLSFQEIERLAVRRIEADGEFIVHLIRKRFGKSSVPLALNLIDPDLLDETLNGKMKNGHQIVMGVELDSFERPVAYHFKQPSETQSKNYKTVRIDANDIIHIFHSERPKQRRGYPRTNAAMFKLHQLRGWEEAAIVGKRVRASVTAFITTPDPDSITDGVSSENEQITDLAPGKIFELPPGAKIEAPNLGGDSGNDTEPVMAAMLRGVAMTLGASYESVSGDFSKTNYSSSRQSLILERDGWRIYQDFITAKFHQRVYEEWLKQAMLAGAVYAPNYYENPSNYKNVQWMPRGWNWVDPQKDTNASIMAMDNNLKTHSEILAEDGKDFRDTMKQIAFERDYMKKLGISKLNSEGKNEQGQDSKETE